MPPLCARRRAPGGRKARDDLSHGREHAKIAAMNTPAITPADRLSLTVFLAIVIHALVIFGVGFSASPARRAVPPLIEVTLAERPSERAPDDYDYLAQANQDGGGLSEERQRPQREARALSQGVPEGYHLQESTAGAPPPPQPEQRPELVQLHSPRQPAATPREPTPDINPSVAVHELMPGEPQLARLSEAATARDDGVPRYPSKRRIDARTRSHAAAAYMYQWVNKVEHIGNLNYPEEARRRNLTGRVILEVTLRPDGRLYGVRVLQGSGHPVLDQAAVRIVELAAPYEPVPADTLEGHDLLVIVRTWEFLQDSQVHAR